MDFVEIATKSYLETLGLGTVVYEPLGPRTFPDFSIADNIGIECTRLVNIVERNSKLYNVTELDPQIIQSLENAIASVKFGKLTASYFVSIDYRVDINIKEAKLHLVNYLNALVLEDNIPPQQIVLDPKLTATIHLSSKVLETPFVLGGAMSWDDGGWVLDQIVNQTKEAVFRKTYKAKAQSDKFNEWWFAVASSLTIGVPDNYVEFLLSELKQVELWSRLLLVNREKPEKSRMLDLRPT